ncbi:MAG: hypothetical protein H6623_06495 [Bdellovibrionaceae bacterium]|nr:hypothetical protein [Pseudobdellovibrionaceae bacterium]
MSKHSYLVGFLGIVLFSLSAQAKLGSLFPAIDGGISGGGGFFISPKAPNGQNSSGLTGQQVVKKAYKYIYNLSEAHERSQPIMIEVTPTLNKFLESPNLHSALEKIKPLAYEKGSCLNQNYEAVDGSTYSFKPGTVCISAFNLQYNVAASERLPQAVALLVHEYAEVIGLTEDEAVHLQEHMLKNMMK